MNIFFKVVILFLMLEYSSSDTSIDFLYVANFENCEGKNVANYTQIGQFRQDTTCSSDSVTGTGNNQVLISSDSKGQKAVNIMNGLAISHCPAGSYDQVDSLSIIVNGPLQGKYTYERIIQLSVRYLKKCSSVLGYSYVTTKSSVLLIIDQLNVNALITPTGAFHDLQKSASTICNGIGYIV